MKPRVNIHFYLTDSREPAKTILEQMRKSGDIEYAGYMDDTRLEKDLTSYIGQPKNVKKISTLSKKQRGSIENLIKQVITQCHNRLPHPEPRVHVFIFPWYVDAATSRSLGGVNALAPFQNTILIFVDVKRYTQRSLRETLVHEYCHLVYYTYHPKSSYTLGEHMIIEGLAEDFREDTIGGNPAPWSVSLSKPKAKHAYEIIYPKIKSRNLSLISAVLFGNEEYTKWTGYSIGYWKVKEILNGKKRDWQEIIKLSSSLFLKK